MLWSKLKQKMWGLLSCPQSIDNNRTRFEILIYIRFKTKSLLIQRVFLLFVKSISWNSIRHISPNPVYSHWNLVAEIVRRNFFFQIIAFHNVQRLCFLPLPLVSWSLCLHMHLDDCFPCIQPRTHCVTVTVKRSVIHRYGTIAKTYCNEYENLL